MTKVSKQFVLKNRSMINPVKKELIRLANQILAQGESLNTQDLLERVQELYKQLVVLEHQESHEVSDHQASQEVPPLMETINELVTELPLEEESAAINDLFASVANPVFVKKKKAEDQEPVSSLSTIPPKKLNEALGKGIHIGLNDRLAFIKNLFDTNAEDYQRVISQVQTCANWEEAQLFIEQMIKPDYNNWEGKEEFEKRFLKCIETNF